MKAKYISSTDSSFKNREERIVVREELVKLLDVKFIDKLLDKTFHTIWTMFRRE